MEVDSPETRLIDANCVECIHVYLTFYERVRDVSIAIKIKDSKLYATKSIVFVELLVFL